MTSSSTDLAPSRVHRPATSIACAALKVIPGSVLRPARPQAPAHLPGMDSTQAWAPTKAAWPFIRIASVATRGALRLAAPRFRIAPSGLTNG